MNVLLGAAREICVFMVTRDWLDGEGIVARQARLDAPYILAHLSELRALKESPDAFERATHLLRGQP